MTITLNKETAVFNLQNMFRRSHSSVANELSTVVHFNFFIRVRYKIMRQKLALQFEYMMNTRKTKNSSRMKRKKNNIIKRKETNLDASTAD